MLKAKLRESKDLLGPLVERLKRQARGTRVKVGVLAANAVREGDEPYSNAQIAAVHEFGAPRAGIPERPFLRPAFDEQREKNLRALQSGVRRILDGKATAVEVLDRVGMRQAAETKKFITSGPPIAPPNSPEWAAEKMRFAMKAQAQNNAKRRKKNAPERIGPIQLRTLVHTGQLVNAITHVVEIAGKEQDRPAKKRGTKKGAK